MGRDHTVILIAFENHRLIESAPSDCEGLRDGNTPAGVARRDAFALLNTERESLFVSLSRVAAIAIVSVALQSTQYIWGVALSKGGRRGRGERQNLACD